MTADTLPPGLPPAPYRLLAEPPEALSLVTRKLRAKRYRQRGGAVLLASAVLITGVAYAGGLSGETSQPQQLAEAGRDVRISEDVLIKSLPSTWTADPVVHEPRAGRDVRVSLLAPSGVRVIVTVSTGSEFSGYLPSDPPPQPGSRADTVRGHHAWVLEDSYGGGDGLVVRRVVQWLEQPRLAMNVKAFRPSPTTQDELVLASREVISWLEIVPWKNPTPTPTPTLAQRCSGPVPTREGPTETFPMRPIGQPGLPRIKVVRGRNFQGVLPAQVGRVTVSVAQDADAVKALAESTLPDGARLLPYLAVDEGDVTIVATSTTDGAVRYAVAVTITC